MTHPPITHAPKHLPLEEYQKAVALAVLERVTEAQKRAEFGILPFPMGPIQPTQYPAGGRAGVIATSVRRQPKGDQACTAYAVAAAMECFEARRRGTSQGVPFLSVDHIFERAGVDPGRAVAAAAQGVLDELCRPFQSPTSCAPNEQPNHLWFGRLNLMRDPLDQMRAAMCNALVTRGPLVMVIPVFANWDAFVGSGVFVASGSAIGAHAVAVVGYEPTAHGNAWLVKNSYGTEWGDSGYARIAWNDPDVQPEVVVYETLNVQPPELP